MAAQPGCQLQRRQRRQRHGRQQLAAPASYNTNPQNVEQCQTPPSPEHTAEQAVSIQLAALQRNDEPWGNHGVQTAYEWALDVGGLDPSMFFGFSKDLYHFDHFMGMFANRLGELINCEAFSVEGAEERPASDGAPPTAVVTAAVTPARGGEPRRFEFHLRRKAVGARKGSLMTYMVRRLDQE
ncbi:hypothetical protein ABPG75_008132 [Micractinium tetrahymenae]